MAMAKYETEKFTGRNDFGLWPIKMKAILTQQGLAAALVEEKSSIEGSSKDGEGKEKAVDDKVDLAKKKEMLEKAHSAIILCLGDKVLREVAKEESAAAVWKKLESIYMQKSLASRLYSKQKLYSFKIVEGKEISDQLEEFNKILDDLENIEVKLESEDKAIVLLNALPKSYEHLKDALLYGKEEKLTLDDVQNALKSKEMQKTTETKPDSGAEGLNVKAKPKKKFKKNQGKKNYTKKGFHLEKLQSMK